MEGLWRGEAFGEEGVGKELNTNLVFGGHAFRMHLFFFYAVVFEGEASRTGTHPSPRDHLLTAVFITWSSSPSYLSVGHLITSR